MEFISKCDLLKNTEGFEGMTLEAYKSLQQKPKGEDLFELVTPDSDTESESALEGSMCSKCDTSGLNNKHTYDTTYLKKTKSYFNVESHENGADNSFSDKSFNNFMKATSADADTEPNSCAKMMRRDSDKLEMIDGCDNCKCNITKTSPKKGSTFSPVVINGYHPEERPLEQKNEEFGIHSCVEIHTCNSRTPQEIKTEGSSAKKPLRLNCDDYSNFHELSSIYENTEEELCTPDREFKINLKTLHDYKKIRKERESQQFYTCKNKFHKKSSFIQRMNVDICERNIRDYEIRRMSKSRPTSQKERKISKKRANSISKRLMKGRECSLERRIRNSQSFKELNHPVQLKPSKDKISKNIFKSKRKSVLKDYVVPQKTTKVKKMKIKKRNLPKQKDFISINKMQSSQKPQQKQQKLKEKKLLHKKMFLKQLKLQALKLEHEIKTESLELKSCTPETSIMTQKAQKGRKYSRFEHSPKPQRRSRLKHRNSIVSSKSNTSSFVTTATKVGKSSTISDLQSISSHRYSQGLFSIPN
ncbi:unnamed protein product [Moneuplotes crassus]|uniref:Uncharacterized protein n=1 Tax=Euplotes crassus TaxID=5936 RepID=A0AAD1X946_EUPCR|nr:unnamed protein product [Moneuplotes crassus]